MKKDLTILQGKTFSLPIRWETTPIVYKPITAIERSAPVVITCPSHGVPDGWRAAVVSAKGMTELNATGNPPTDKDYYVATVLTPDTLEFNAISSANFKAYSSGGYLAYNTPAPLNSYTGRIKIKDKVGGAVLASSEADDAPLNVLEVLVDDDTKLVTLTISAEATADFTFTKGVYDLELVSPNGVVTSLLQGKVSVTKEITT